MGLPAQDSIENRPALAHLLAIGLIVFGCVAGLGPTWRKGQA